MNTREIAAKYRMEQWTQAIREKASKGESIEEFCERRGISRNTYFYWQRKLRETACQELLPTTGEILVAPSGWAVCEESKADTRDKGITIEIGKSRVKACGEVSAEQLEKVCRVLMRLC